MDARRRSMSALLRRVRPRAPPYCCGSSRPQRAAWVQETYITDDTEILSASENDRVIVLFPSYRKGNKLITERAHYFDLVKSGGGVGGKVLHRDLNRDRVDARRDTRDIRNDRYRGWR